MYRLLPFALWVACATEATPSVDYAVYDYGGDLKVRDRLIRADRMLDDLGGKLVGQRNEALAAALGVAMTDVADPGPDEALWVVAGHHHDPATAALASQGRVVWAGEDVELMVVPTSAPDPGFRCHGSVRQVRAASLRASDAGAQRVLGVTAPNPNIAAMLGEVDLSRIQDDVDTLVAFGSRRHGQPGEVAAQGFLEQRFAALGLAVETLDYDGGADVVCGVLPGQTDPDRLVIVGAHYDSVNWQGSATSPAPGADDDASGTAAVLELARVLSQAPGFDHTLRFCGWSGEELGLLGSGAEAARLAAADADVVGMIQLDMIGYTPAGGVRQVEFILNDTTASLNAFLIDVFATYVPSLPTTQGFLGAGSSDHASFFAQGFPAASPFEDTGGGSPLIHTSQDVVGASINDWTKAEAVTRGTLAGLAELARPLSVTLTHTPLADTTDDLGPRTISVLAEPQTAATVTGVTLRWRRLGEAAWNDVAMTAAGDRWSTTLPPVPSPAQVEYTVRAIDSAGNVASLPDALGGQPFRFAVGAREVVAGWDFEAVGDEGWTHVQLAGQDDWQRGTPAGLSTDPSSAASGLFAWGNDLGPTGWNGAYRANVDNYLESPPVDTRGRTDLRLRYQRWLNVEKGEYDQARVLVGGDVVWENPFDVDVTDTSWVIEDLDVSAQADDRADVRLRFTLTTDGGLELGGWNLDDVELYSLASSDSLGALRLLGPATAGVGETVTLRVAGLPPGGSWSLVVSTSDAGTTVMGTPLDVGAPFTVLGTAQADAQGVGTLSFVVPPVAAGLEAFLEAGAIVGGQLVTTNLHTLIIS